MSKAVTICFLNGYQVPYYVAITTMYAAQEAAIGGWLAAQFPLYVGPLIALALGLVGMRRTQLSRANCLDTHRRGSCHLN